jgi:hypothetical protein
MECGIDGDGLLSLGERFDGCKDTAVVYGVAGGVWVRDGDVFGDAFDCVGSGRGDLVDSDEEFFGDRAME